MKTLWLLVFMAFPFGKSDDGPPNTLTRDEVAKGWILLFDGESTIGWKIDGQGKAENGELILGGEKGPTLAKTTTTLFSTDRGYVIEHQTAWSGEEAPSVRLSDQERATIAAAAGPDFEPHGRDILFAGSNNPTANPISCVIPSNTTLRFRSVAFRKRGLLPVFDGKGLDGWKQIAGENSNGTIAVTPSREISIKGGPVELQTDAEWDDFYLQLEIKMVGNDVDSGVCFRAIRGELGGGYEARIGAGSADEYGVGGIQGLQKARKAIAKRDEWFTMTVVAQGNQLSTWVDGIQVVDVADKRERNFSARIGSKTVRGPIGLHSTDQSNEVLFRNLRIAPLPRKLPVKSKSTRTST